MLDEIIYKAYCDNLKSIESKLIFLEKLKLLEQNKIIKNSIAEHDSLALHK